MKYLSLSACFGMLMSISCSKVDGVTSSESADKLLQKQTWRITGFYDDGYDRTADFTGYAFTFSDNGTLTLHKNGIYYTGAWVMTTTTSTTDSTEVEAIRFEFEDTRPVIQLNKTWEVMSKTTKTVHLRYQDNPLEKVYDDIFFRINY